LVLWVRLPPCFLPHSVPLDQLGLSALSSLHLSDLSGHQILSVQWLLLDPSPPLHQWTPLLRSDLSFRLRSLPSHPLVRLDLMGLSLRLGQWVHRIPLDLSSPWVRSVPSIRLVPWGLFLQWGRKVQSRLSVPSSLCFRSVLCYQWNPWLPYFQSVLMALTAPLVP
jgi:hypothetical protein